MSQNGLPYYKAYPRDFFEGTRGMPGELKGAYRMVLDLIYQHGGRLPNDARHIAGELGYSVRKWNSILSELVALGKLRCDLGIISNFRADKELVATRSYQDKQRENASKTRENNNIPEAMAKPRDKPKPSHTEPDTDKKKEEEEEYAREPSFFRRVQAAAGYNPDDVTPTHWMPPKAELEVLAWLDLPGMTEDLALRHVAESTRAKGRANGPRAFRDGIRALSAQATAPPLTPAEVTPFPRRRQTDGERLDDHLDALKARLAVQRLE